MKTYESTLFQDVQQSCLDFLEGLKPDGIIRTCKVCLKKFEAYKASSDYAKIYCSDVCCKSFRKSF